MPQRPMLKIAEVFASIQGEGLRQGVPSIFVRLAGCRLRCSFCDTKRAWSGGRQMEPHEIVARIMALRSAYPASWVSITGGEPFLQNLRPLVRLLRKDLSARRGLVDRFAQTALLQGGARNRPPGAGGEAGRHAGSDFAQGRKDAPGFSRFDADHSPARIRQAPKPRAGPAASRGIARGRAGQRSRRAPDPKGPGLALTAGYKSESAKVSPALFS